MKELAKADATRLAGFDSSLESSRRTIQKNQAILEDLAAEIKQLQVPPRAPLPFCAGTAHIFLSIKPPTQSPLPAWLHHWELLCAAAF